MSRWESSDQAYAATEAAAARVAENIEHVVKLQQSNTGEIALSSMVAASRPR